MAIKKMSKNNRPQWKMSWGLGDDFGVRKEKEQVEMP